MNGQEGFQTEDSRSRIPYCGGEPLSRGVPSGDQIAPQALVALMRAFARMGGATIQFNCVSVDDMRDAQVHPERHRDLQVRICGLSAYFIAMDRAVQDEIIERAVLTIRRHARR